MVEQAEIRKFEDGTEAKLEPREDTRQFLERIGQKLKNPQTANIPTTAMQVADEIDAHLRKLGNEKRVETSGKSTVVRK